MPSAFTCRHELDLKGLTLPIPISTTIAEFGFLSNGQTAALVNKEGAIDWYCPKRFDAPSVFGRLLDSSAGHWTIQPVEPFASERRYVGDSLVLKTVFTTPQGTVALTDAFALEMGVRGHQIGRHSPPILLRQIEGLKGNVEVQVTFCPRPNYGLSVPTLLQRNGQIIAQAGSLELTLLASCQLEIGSSDATARVTVTEGQTISFALIDRLYREENDPLPAVDVARELENARAGWQSWADMHQGYQGLYVEPVRRSALVLQGLTYQPNGAVVAAATTSVPETLGDGSNWDYRFVWLRDLALTMQALWVASCPDEVQRFLGWVDRALGDLSDPQQPVQIVYGIEGERDLTEHVLPHLEGYQESPPVRVGNDAWYQKQLDVLGEVVDSIYLFREQLDFSKHVDGSAKPVSQLVIQLADRAARTWQEPDAGMWEARDQERQYLTSKVMCWVALDRAIKLAPQLGEKANAQQWEKAREEIYTAVIEQGWNPKIEAFAGAFGSDRLDASVLMMPLLGFLPATDPKMAATIRTIQRELTLNGLVCRWQGEKNGFLLCTYWLVECLALLGDVEQAKQLFEQTTAHANDLGLLTEMVDIQSGQPIGNFPQAFSHIGLINAAWRLTKIADGTDEGLNQQRQQ